MQLFDKLFSPVKQGSRSLFLYFSKNIGYFTKTNRLNTYSAVLSNPPIVVCSATLREHLEKEVAGRRANPLCG